MYIYDHIYIYVHTQHRIRFSTILQSERQVVTNPAVRHGTDLLLVTFSFLCFVVCSFVGVVILVVAIIDHIPNGWVMFNGDI